ncbi:MAG TPA: choice-of-anchor P family protein [Streptosporangiaceae bacterium]|jgi:hypothetical protein
MFRKIRTVWLVAILAMLAGTLATVAPGIASAGVAPANAKETGYLGTAYGTQVVVGSTVKSGRSAVSTLGCTSAAGVTHSNTALSIGVPELSTGTIDTSVSSEATATEFATTSSATIQNVSALGGLITATAVKSVSTTSKNKKTGKFSTSAAGTQFVGLKVAGIPVGGTPPANTKLTLPGVGFVELNQQTSHVGTTKASLRVIGLHIVVNLSTPLAPLGTHIDVGFASSGLGGPVAGLLDGLAYGAHANVGGIVIAGNLFPETLSCLGTSGATKNNTGVALGIPGVLSSGTVADTVEGTAGHKNASATVTSTIEGLNLLSGIVSATAIEANVTATGNPPSYTDNSEFLGLSVAGFPAIGDNVPPNTKLTLGGIGTLWLHRRFEFSHQIKVIMVQLVVTVPGNPAGLAPGTTVNIGSAQASVG